MVLIGGCGDCPYCGGVLMGGSVRGQKSFKLGTLYAYTGKLSLDDLKNLLKLKDYQTIETDLIRGSVAADRFAMKFHNMIQNGDLRINPNKDGTIDERSVVTNYIKTARKTYISKKYQCDDPESFNRLPTLGQQMRYIQSCKMNAGPIHDLPEGYELVRKIGRVERILKPCTQDEITKLRTRKQQMARIRACQNRKNNPVSGLTPTIAAKLPFGRTI